MQIFDFLALPREIRDEIYRYALLPSSKPYLIEVFRSSHRSNNDLGSLSSSPRIRGQLIPKERFKLCLEPTPESANAAYYDGDRDCAAMSMMRVNRQIYKETHSLFWEHATFYFGSFYHRSGNYPSIGVTKMLKGMGQTSSRLIRSICINMDLPRNPDEGQQRMRKVFGMLASRARYGNFRRLELLWDMGTLEVLLQDHTSWVRRHLEDLRTAGDGYEKIILFPRKLMPRRKASLRDGSRWKDLTEALHMAFGGRLYLGKDLVWENYSQVGSVCLEG